MDDGCEGGVDVSLRVGDCVFRVGTVGVLTCRRGVGTASGAGALDDMERRDMRGWPGNHSSTWCE